MKTECWTIDSALETVRTAQRQPSILGGYCFNMTFDPEERDVVERALHALRDGWGAHAPRAPQNRGGDG